jgi:hypothetical protein
MHERIDQRAIVGAMAGRLHDDIARKAEMIAQREQLRLRRIAWSIFALGRVWKLAARAEYVTVRVDAARRHLEARL